MIGDDGSSSPSDHNKKVVDPSFSNWDKLSDTDKKLADRLVQRIEAYLRRTTDDKSQHHHVHLLPLLRNTSFIACLTNTTDVSTCCDALADAVEREACRHDSAEKLEIVKLSREADNPEALLNIVESRVPQSKGRTRSWRKYLQHIGIGSATLMLLYLANKANKANKANEANEARANVAKEDLDKMMIEHAKSVLSTGAAQEKRNRKQEERHQEEIQHQRRQTFGGIAGGLFAGLLAKRIPQKNMKIVTQKLKLNQQDKARHLLETEMQQLQTLHKTLEHQKEAAERYKYKVRYDMNNVLCWLDNAITEAYETEVADGHQADKMVRILTEYKKRTRAQAGIIEKTNNEIERDMKKIQKFIELEKNTNPFDVSIDDTGYYRKIQ